MTRDAYVFCDCFERGRLKTLPRPEWQVRLESNGGLEADFRDAELFSAFDQWYADACEHRYGCLLSHELGNVGSIGAIRSELEKHSDWFPILIEKVVWSGVHGGDFLDVDDVRRLSGELESLKALHVEDQELAEEVRLFTSKMEELVECSLRIGKPIAF